MSYFANYCILFDILLGNPNDSKSATPTIAIFFPYLIVYKHSRSAQCAKNVPPGVNDAFCACGRKPKTCSGLRADSLIFPQQPILDGYDKGILIIIRGQSRDTSSIYCLPLCQTLLNLRKRTWITVATCWEKMSNSLISAGIPGPSSRWANRASLKHKSEAGLKTSP